EWNENELLWTNVPNITEAAVSSNGEITTGQLLRFYPRHRVLKPPNFYLPVVPCATIADTAIVLFPIKN
ncbi:hypothetical protein MJD09_12710, partial [bacterium]|nr:hypothetical protein [bacterium]